MKQKLWISFFLSLFASLFFSAFLPLESFVFFAPFLILALNHYSLFSCLWLSLFCGLLFDLFTSLFFASSALNYLLATFCFYPGRKLLNEKPLSLCLASLVFSLFFGILQFFLFLIFRKPCDFGSSAGALFFTTPLMNVLYTFFWFVLPLKGIEMAKKNFAHWSYKKRKFSDE
jgi:hypothetical protein